MAQQFKPSPTPTKVAAKEPESDNVKLLYGKSNYTLLAASVLVVAFGFVLMTGTTDIYSNTKIVLAPIVVLAGFGLGFYALLKKPEANV